MSNTGDKLKALIDREDICKAVGTLIQLPFDDLVVICAFFVKLHSPIKMNANYLS
jgi:hypothetical protein